MVKFKTGELHDMLCGAINFKSMERKEGLVYIKIFRVLWCFLLKCLTNLFEIAYCRISVFALMVILIITQLDLIRGKFTLGHLGFFDLSLKIFFIFRWNLNRETYT
jgi:hypothetical protein